MSGGLSAIAGLVAGNNMRNEPSFLDRKGRSLRNAIDTRLMPDTAEAQQTLRAPAITQPVDPAQAQQTMPAPAITQPVDPAQAQQNATAARPLLFQLNDRFEGGGQYDTLFGHSQRDKFSNVDVSSMTIGQLKQFSDPNGEYGQWVKGELGRIGQKPRVATPMGGHQIVGTTLRNAATDMGLSDDTVFNVATQDAIAMHLARNRINSAGTMEGKRAALRAEWEGYAKASDAELDAAIMEIEGLPANASFAGPSGSQARGTPPFFPTGATEGPAAQQQVEQIAQVQPTEASQMQSSEATAPVSSGGAGGSPGGEGSKRGRSLPSPTQSAQAAPAQIEAPQGAPQSTMQGSAPAPRDVAGERREQAAWLGQFFATKGA
jgi:hypothetical protein